MYLNDTYQISKQLKITTVKHFHRDNLLSDLNKTTVKAPVTPKLSMIPFHDLHEQTKVLHQAKKKKKLGKVSKKKINSKFHMFTKRKMLKVFEFLNGFKFIP